MGLGCHIDTSEPYAPTWAFVRPSLEGYDAAVFTLGGFVPPDLPIQRVEIIPPDIDPESPKGLELDVSLAQRVLQWIGIRVDRPFITQVSRFDPWKDPLGVIAAYRLVKQEVPDLQLALVGSMALDDPEGWAIYRDIQHASRDDPSIHLFTNLTGVGNLEVNAFQRLSNVVIQKSRREGLVWWYPRCFGRARRWWPGGRHAGRQQARSACPVTARRPEHRRRAHRQGRLVEPRREQL